MAWGSRSQSSSFGLSSSVEHRLAAADEALARAEGVVDPAVEQVVGGDRVLVQPGDVVRLGERVHRQLPVHRPLVLARLDVGVARRCRSRRSRPRRRAARRRPSNGAGGRVGDREHEPDTARRPAPRSGRGSPCRRRRSRARRPGNAVRRAVEAVGPGVVRAADRAQPVAARRGQQRRAAVPAHVDEALHRRRRAGGRRRAARRRP